MPRPSRVARLLTSLVFGIGACSIQACRTSQDQASEAESLALAPITLSIASTIIENLLEYGLEKQWDQLYDRYLNGQKQLGDVSDQEALRDAKNINAPLPEDFQRQVKIKLNALQDILAHDYVRGSPDSAALLASMVEKVNDIRSALETYADPAVNPQYLGTAVATYQSYLLVAALSVAIHQERLGLAHETSGIKPEVLSSLRRSGSVAARAYAAYINKLHGEVFDSFARRSLLTYTYQHEAKSSDFDFAKGVRYQACVKSEKGTLICGAASTSICANELELPCVDRAQSEARSALAAAGLDQALLDGLRRKAFAIDLPAFAQRLVQKAGSTGT